MKNLMGYLDQLKRARRFQSRIEALGPRGDVEYQDDVWAFFQNCWHIKDWVINDPSIHRDIEKRVVAAAEASSILSICFDMATGTKHRNLRKPIAGAEHSHTNTTIIPGVLTKLDCIIEFEDGQTRSAREVARECMDEWDRILRDELLATV